MAQNLTLYGHAQVKARAKSGRTFFHDGGIAGDSPAALPPGSEESWSGVSPEPTATADVGVTPQLQQNVCPDSESRLAPVRRAARRTIGSLTRQHRAVRGGTFVTATRLEARHTGDRPLPDGRGSDAHRSAVPWSGSVDRHQSAPVPDRRASGGYNCRHAERPDNIAMEPATCRVGSRAVGVATSAAQATGTISFRRVLRQGRQSHDSVLATRLHP